MRKPITKLLPFALAGLMWMGWASCGPGDDAGAPGSSSGSSSGQAGFGGSSGPVLAMAADDTNRLWHLDDFELTDQTGEAKKLSDLAGEPFVAAFIFTRCAGPCPRLSNDMTWLQSKLQEAGNPARLVSISVDPEYDTPKILTKYAERQGADPERWWFLTGPKHDVAHISQDVFKQGLSLRDPNKPGSMSEPTHSTQLIVVDRDGKVAGLYGTEDQKGRKRALARLEFLVASGADEGSDDTEDAPDAPSGE